MKRKVIKIDQNKCNGCGLCIPNCPEGALQMIDGKARLISDLFCDGLGACLGHCPEGAIEIEEREAEPYDEKKVMANIVKQGTNTTLAHLKHLKEHGETNFYNQAVEYLKANKIEIPKEEKKMDDLPCGCPGTQVREFKKDKKVDKTVAVSQPSELAQWPVQLMLVPPAAPYFKKADVILSADCVAYALGNFHVNYLKGKALAIACPKLDQGLERYIQKITALIDEAEINTLTVMIMEVPCCQGLLRVAAEGAKAANRKIPIKAIVVGVQGNILKEEWVTV